MVVFAGEAGELDADGLKFATQPVRIIAGAIAAAEIARAEVRSNRKPILTIRWTGLDM
jgi:hypothetical protein